MDKRIGNKFWLLREDLTDSGKKLSVNQVIEGAKEYISRCVNEKLYEVDFVGKDADEVLRPKMIVMSIFGLCHHLGISKPTWDNWKKSDDKQYFSVLTRVETTMTAYNIEGASAGLLQQNIIARIEGLADKKEHESPNGTMSPKPTINLTMDDKTIDIKVK
jgi:hypothetical protein